jgi:crossover junction endodeoxyribonuclease RusA
MTVAVVFSLPFPPSVNNLFPGKERRFPSDQYKAWRKAAAPMVPAVRVEGEYDLHLLLDRPDRRRRDVGNYEKGPSDLLVERGVIEGDHLCARLVAEWSGPNPVKDPKVRVAIAPAGRLNPLSFGELL